MNKHLYTSSPLEANRELLFVGFDRDFDANIFHFPYDNPNYRYTLATSAEQAREWLAERVDGRFEQFQLPYAVVVETHWLVDNGFHFVHDFLQPHPDLRFIPVIALAENGRQVEKSFFLKNGVDDCYPVPVEWAKLESRLEFLNQYKARLLEQAGKVSQEHFDFRMPLLKRLFDIAVSSVLIALCFLPGLLIALAIWLETKGPVIYTSKRAGTGYRVFDFLKFRSMYVNADKRLSDMQHLNQYEQDGGPVFRKFVRDPRVTRVGRFIRKFSIDELPQLVNILRGDMSLVGNRPLPLYEAEALTRDEWSARFLAPAGLTGLWQVTRRGRALMSTEERVALDVSYAHNHSAAIDLKIMLRTFGAIVQQEEV